MNAQEIMKIPISRKLMREWVESFSPKDVEEFRNAILWRIDDGLFVPIKYRGKNREGYCNHGMNVIECNCWDWCKLAPTCPQLSKEGQDIALRLYEESKWNPDQTGQQ